MKLKLLGVFAAVTLLTAWQASANTLYIVQDSYSPDGSAIYGSTPVNGTITTNGNVGILAQTDIVDWSLAIGAGSTFTLTPANSFVELEGKNFSATGLDLLWDYGGDSAGLLFANLPSDEWDFPKIPGVYGFVAYGSGGFAAESDFCVPGRSDCLGYLLADSRSGIAVIGIDPPTTVTPIPSTLPLFAAGLGVLCLFGWGRRRFMKQIIRSGAFVLCAAALCCLSQGANAVSVNVTVISDDTVTIPTPDLFTPTPIASPFTFGTTLGPITGTSPGNYVSPFGDNISKYTSVEGAPHFHASSAAYSLGTGNIFEIFWGSVDSYNTLTFYAGPTFVGSITGNDLFHAPTGTGHDLVKLIMTNFTYFDTVVISSTEAAFEFANPRVCPDSPCEIGLAPTPLPATFPLFLTGLGALGLMGWRRKRGVPSQAS